MCKHLRVHVTLEYGSGTHSLHVRLHHTLTQGAFDEHVDRV